MNKTDSETRLPPVATVEMLTEFGPGDLQDLSDAAEAAIIDGGGFGWISPPPRETLEAFWRGVLIIPERHLFVGRLDGVIAGSCQIQRPPKNNEAQSHTCKLTTNFVAPWGRGHGLSRNLIEIAENYARREGFKVLTLDVRETQHAAIRLYERLGYVRFGTLPHYAYVRDGYVAGHFYYKELDAA
ncbi:GNAT family N-acetyltransferase [Nisaea sediminum]|uniref:GNAT family N-acetyltransferase n=1 Tax=Nisaea sediminum TaxID=2775867 RepID=UPI001865FC75|nr:GNAT family N-acetyltransferase [Nisaea sediminum]